MSNCNTCPSNGSCNKDQSSCGVENNPLNKINKIKFFLIKLKEKRFKMFLVNFNKYFIKFSHSKYLLN